MAKTIQDYQREYQEARARGDSAGMQAANDGANAIRRQQGQAEQRATEDINKFKGSSTGSITGSVKNGITNYNKSNGSSGGVTGNGGGANGWTERYQGGNAELDKVLSYWGQKYQEARAAGDGNAMQQASNEANKLRNQYGYAAEDASADIGKFLGGSSGTYGGGGMYGGMEQDLSNYLEDMYASRRRDAIAQLEAAYRKNMNALDRSTVGVSEQYQNARNQAAGASEVAKRNFAEYAAASGLNSGAGSQAELARTVGLQNDLNALTQDEANFYSNIELQKAQAEQEYNSAIAQAEASNDYALAQALYQEKVRVQEQLLAQEQQQREQAFQEMLFKYQQQRDQTADSQWREQFNYGVSSARQQQLASYGERFLKQGIMPSQEMLSAMGITAAAAQDYIDRVNMAAAMSAKSSRYTSGGGGNDDEVEPPAPDPVPEFTGSGYRNLVANLSRMEDSTREDRVPSTAAEMIRKAMNAGTITEAEARKLLSQYGIAV